MRRAAAVPGAEHYRELADMLHEVSWRATPQKWAGVQNNLGNALREGGKLSRDARLFAEAVAAYQEAFTVFTAARQTG